MWGISRSRLKSMNTFSTCRHAGAPAPETSANRRGVDVGAKQEIYRLIEALAADGMGVLFASSEMEEVLGLADRVLVMHEGRLVGEVSGDAMSEEAVMHLATGSAEVEA